MTNESKLWRMAGMSDEKINNPRAYSINLKIHLCENFKNIVFCYLITIIEGKNPE